MEDAAAHRHPLHVPGAERAAVAQAVAVVDRAGEDVGDGFYPAMRVPGEPREVVLRVLVAEVVQQQERVELAGVPESERPTQPHARALDGGLRLNDRLDRPDRHGTSCATVGT